MPDQARSRVGREPLAAARAVEKMLRQGNDVGNALAQGRQMDRYHMQSIEQILAELSLPHPLLEIAMGCGDHANIDRLRPATDRGDHALLKGPENLRLHSDIHVADLIEKQRSALGFTKRTFPVAGCPGEGATHMAKQLAFHELG